MTVAETYNWLKQIPSAILQKDHTPLMGFPPAFPWQQLSSKLQQLFQLDSLEIKPVSSYAWLTAEELSKGFGDKAISLHVEITPTGGKAAWLMSEQDIAFLMALLLAQQSDPLHAIPPDLQEGFYQFLALEVINTLPEIEFDKALSAHILHDNELPKETSLCLDVSISIHQRTLMGRLIISPDLQQKWKERYAQRTLDSGLSQKVAVTIHLEGGKTTLTSSEWAKVSLGDFLILERCSIKPNGEGKVILTIDNIPLFRGKLKEGKLKILELSQYHEVDSHMATPTEDNAEDNNHTEEADNANEQQDQNQVPEPQQEDFHTDEDWGNLEEDIYSEEHQEKWPPPPEKRAPETATTAETEEQPTLKLNEIPLSVIVEVGRLQMSLQKLMELQPGNVIDLNIHPENGVDLIVSGKRIAKGELLLLGETLGVRILDIG